MVWFSDCPGISHNPIDSLKSQIFMIDTAQVHRQDLQRWEKGWWSLAIFIQDCHCPIQIYWKPQTWPAYVLLSFPAAPWKKKKKQVKLPWRACFIYTQIPKSFQGGNILEIMEMLHVMLCCTKSLKARVYFAMTAHLNSDETRFQCRWPRVLSGCHTGSYNCT